MKKINVDSLVSLIIEQINSQQPSEAPDEGFDPHHFTYIDDLEDYPELFQPEEEESDVSLNPPENVDNVNPNDVSPESEVDEMAQVTKEPIELLEEPLHIPANTLVVKPDKYGHTVPIPNILCIDPDTGEYGDPGIIISNEMMVMPSGERILRFANWGEEKIRDRTEKRLHYLVFPRDFDEDQSTQYLTDKPRNSRFNSQYVRPDYETEPPNELPKDKEIRLARILAITKANIKRYGIYPIINDLFSRDAILDRLDSCLIPETWAGNIRTEHTWNEELRKKFGATDPEIDVDFYAGRDILDVDDAIREMMDVRADLAMGEVADEDRVNMVDDDGNPMFDMKRDRKYSAALKRRHANYIYTAGGNWEGRQRVHDEEFFEKAGGETMRYKLKSQDIQKGLKKLFIESKLEIKGYVVGNDYVLKATLNSFVNARNLNTGEGEFRGELFPIDSIVASLMKPLPEDFDPEHFNFDTNIKFFVSEGRKRASNKSGFFPQLMDRLGQAILDNVKPDDVMGKIIELAKEAVDQNA